MSENLCKKCGTPIDEGTDICEKCLSDVSKATPTYIDYVVEEDTAPVKKFSGIKITSLILGVLSGLMLLYYSVDITVKNFSQINQYKAMGMQIPASSLIVVFLSLALLYLVSISSIVGGLLPRKYAKCSILLLALPISWGMVNGFPQFIMGLIQKAPFADLSQALFVAIPSFLTLAAAIFAIFTTDENANQLKISEDIFEQDYEDYNEEISNQDDEVIRHEIIEDEPIIEVSENESVPDDEISVEVSEETDNEQ